MSWTLILVIAMTSYNGQPQARELVAHIVYREDCERLAAAINRQFLPGRQAVCVQRRDP